MQNLLKSLVAYMRHGDPLISIMTRENDSNSNECFNVHECCFKTDLNGAEVAP